MNNFWQLFKKKKFLAAIVMVIAIALFFIGFYVVEPLAPAKGYIIVIGLIMTIYGFINILT
ncbi:MAG: hypothetical protein IKC56_05145 [Clostridia bacterium]|nr:hypothetical protein [Clostridia bacterium]